MMSSRKFRNNYCYSDYIISRDVSVRAGPRSGVPPVGDGRKRDGTKGTGERRRQAGGTGKKRAQLARASNGEREKVIGDERRTRVVGVHGYKFEKGRRVGGMGIGRWRKTGVGESGRETDRGEKGQSEGDGENERV